MFQSTDDLRIATVRPLIPPAILLEELPITEVVANVVTDARTRATDIVRGHDDRLLVVVGPCSIHDPAAAKDYADRLLAQRNRLADDVELIMRVYFEKPRTTVGWKGLINDPNLDDQFKINDGLRIARRLLLDLAGLGIPSGSEFLDTITPQFIADLVAWGAIGARTTESQVHRELASGLSMPVGFKNGTDGNVQIAVDAVGAAQHPHHFLSVTKQGISAIVSTTGNDCCHLILRGYNNGTNYDGASVAAASETMRRADLPYRLMVDCSHGNSNKDHRRQLHVANAVAEQIAAGSANIGSVMLESNLVAGKQTLRAGQKSVYGQSITDACLSWDQTVVVLETLAKAVHQSRNA